MEIEVRALRTAQDAATFRRLNEAWVEELFGLEEIDRRQLADPVATYVDPGGAILVAEAAGTVVGCVAVVPDGTGAFELSKMTVAQEHRGRGVGRRLVEAAVARARELGATAVVLASVDTLAPAVHLYEAAGFRHVAPEGPPSPFARANVFMRLDLGPAGSAGAQPPAGRGTGSGSGSGSDGSRIRPDGGATPRGATGTPAAHRIQDRHLGIRSGLLAAPPGPSSATVRAATPADAADLARLARRDGTPLPRGPLLVAERHGRPVAAVGTRDRRVVADPDRPDAEAIDLLRRAAAEERSAARWALLRSIVRGVRRRHGGRAPA